MSRDTSRRAFDELDESYDVHIGGLRDIEQALATQIACMEPVMKLQWRLGKTEQTGEEHLDPITKAVDGASQLIAELDRLGKAVHSQWQLGYPVMHGLVAIGTWAHVEACVTDMLGSWLDRNPTALHRKELRKLKIPAFVLRQEQDDRADSLAHALLQMLKNDRPAQIRHGGFELLELALDAAGLGPPPALATNLRDDLNELCAVRNLHAHRTGKIDATFRERAPGRSARASGWSHVSQVDVKRFMLAATTYLGLLHARACREYPIEAGWVEIDWQPRERMPPNPGEWARALSEYFMKGYRARIAIDAHGDTFRVREASLEHRERGGVSRVENNEAGRKMVSQLLSAAGFPVA